LHISNNYKKALAGSGLITGIAADNTTCAIRGLLSIVATPHLALSPMIERWINLLRNAQ